MPYAPAVVERTMNCRPRTSWAGSLAPCGDDLLTALKDRYRVE
jgi:hypothetical protein